MFCNDQKMVAGDLLISVDGELFVVDGIHERHIVAHLFGVEYGERLLSPSHIKSFLSISRGIIVDNQPSMEA